MARSDDAPPPRRWLRIGLLLAGYLIIMVLGHYAGLWLEHQLGFDPAGPQTTETMLILAIGLLLYIVLLALPFVPGIEISLALFAMFGASVALPIYVATVAALMISFVAGRFFSLAALAGFFNFLQLESASGLVRRLAPMNSRQRVAVLLEIAPSRFGTLLVRFREFALIAALNLPGNALIGGGGGIAMLAGMSGAFPVGRFVLAIAVAALPIPLTMGFAGTLLR